MTTLPIRTIALEEHFLAESFVHEELDPAWSADDLPLDQLREVGPSRIAAMDAGRVDVQVVSHTVLEPEPTGAEWVRRARDANDQLAAAIAEHPHRFAGFATLPLGDPGQAADELERAVRSLGLKGALVNGTAHGRFLDDARFAPVLERAVALEVPLYLHPGPPPRAVVEAYFSGFDPPVSYALATTAWGWHSEAAIHALRLVVSGLFDRLPGLQVIIGHMGEMIPAMMWRIDTWLAPRTKHLELTPTEYLRRNFHITTSGVFDPAAFLVALQTWGADRIMFAVDYPYSPIEQAREFLDGLPLNPADKAKIAHLNAERLLGLAAVSA